MTCLLLVRNRNEVEHHQDYEERGQDAEQERLLIQDRELAEDNDTEFETATAIGNNNINN